MKKLNRKGFTLIELLAVIVIMAIIVVVTVPTIINTIADARVNSIWNLSVATANSYDTMAAQDMIASDKVLSGLTVGNNWECINAVTAKDDKGTSDTNDDVTKKLSEILDLSETDIDLESTTKPAETNPTITKGTTCSAIRLKSNGSAEVLLVAKDGGKFAVSGKTVYALSYEAHGHQK